MKPNHHLLAVALITCVSGAALTPAHAAHMNAGAIDTNGTPGIQAGDALSFVNASGFAVTSTTTQILTLSTVAPFAGLYFSTDITFTALPGTGLTWNESANSGAGGYRAENAFAADPGSFLELNIVNVTGPSGATFGFWEESDTAPRTGFTIGTGVFGPGKFALTNDGVSFLGQPNYVGDGVNDGVGEPPSTPNGNPPVDPYGHIHGRTFTFDQPGEYTVTYMLSDKSGHHPNSAPFSITYSSVPEPTVSGLVIGALALLGARRARRQRQGCGI